MPAYPPKTLLSSEFACMVYHSTIYIWFHFLRYALPPRQILATALTTNNTNVNVTKARNVQSKCCFVLSPLLKGSPLQFVLPAVLAPIHEWRNFLFFKCSLCKETGPAEAVQIWSSNIRIVRRKSYCTRGVRGHAPPGNVEI